jgi:hypothetical protein
LAASDKQDRIRFIDTRTWKIDGMHNENELAKKRNPRAPSCEVRLLPFCVFYTTARTNSHTGQVNEFAFSGGSDVLLITYEASIQMYTFPEREYIGQIAVNSSASVHSVAMDPRGRYVWASCRVVLAIF